MQYLARITILVAALVIFAGGPLLADSDGYFCATPTYVAYDVRHWNVASHEIRVVSLVPPLSQSSVRTISLPDFQVHGMRCTEDAILVLGWDVLYTVSLSSETQRLLLSSKKLASGGSTPPPFSKSDGGRNLGSVARPQVVPLGGLRSKRFLVTELESSNRPCMLRVVSRLEEVDGKGQVRSSLQLYDGWRGTDCCGR